MVRLPVAAYQHVEFLYIDFNTRKTEGSFFQRCPLLLLRISPIQCSFPPTLAPVPSCHVASIPHPETGALFESFSRACGLCRHEIARQQAPNANRSSTLLCQLLALQLTAVRLTDTYISRVHTVLPLSLLSS